MPGSKCKYDFKGDKNMNVLTLDSPLKIGIKDIPMAERKNDNEALIKVHTLGIWRTDIGA
jgi:L-gulonate 5-dehydrogenase